MAGNTDPKPAAVKEAEQRKIAAEMRERAKEFAMRDEHQLLLARLISIGLGHHPS